jgi:hypothetical protein
MPIAVAVAVDIDIDIDMMLAKRKTSVGELADRALGAGHEGGTCPTWHVACGTPQAATQYPLTSPSYGRYAAGKQANTS